MTCDETEEYWNTGKRCQLPVDHEPPHRCGPMIWDEFTIGIEIPFNREEHQWKK